MTQSDQEHLARLVELYGKEEGPQRFAAIQRTKKLIKPWVESGMSLKRVCRRLAKMKYPELYRR